MTEFTERYKTLLDSELVEIISNSIDYQNLAVEAAQEEIARRGLKAVYINKLKLEISTQQNEKQKKLAAKRLKEDKRKETVYSFFDYLNPLQNGIDTTEKSIRLIILVYGGIAIYRIYTEVGMLRFMLTDNEAKWDISVLEYFLPLLLLPVAIFLFWKRSKIGWILLSIFLAYKAVISVGLFFLYLGQEPTGLPMLNAMFPTVSSLDYLFSLLFFGGTLWQISKLEMREVFLITKKDMGQSIGITVGLTVVYIALTFV